MRLFIAIAIPTDVRRRLWEVTAELRDASVPVRWVAPEAMHLTLKFLGGVGEEREPEIVAALDQVGGGARPFTLALGGFGTFPPTGSPRVVWLGCDRAPPLELLQHGVERAMAGLGFPLEGRPFHPHVTLGRSTRGARAAALRPLGPTLDRLAFADEIRVESLDLMLSQLGAGGPRYERRHAARLGSSA